MKPVASGYMPKGLSVYVTGKGPKGILFIQDIFGNHANAFQFADYLAEHGGFTVAMPDFFRNNPWPSTVWPPDFAGAEWQAFYKRITTYETVNADVISGLSVLKERGITDIGCVGICWGAKVAMKALAQGLVKSVACAHPSFLDASDGTNAKGPTCMLMSKDEAPLLDLKAALDAHPWHAKNVWKRYDELPHGFLGARGPLEQAFTFDAIPDPIAKQVNEGAEITAKFLKDTV